MGWAAFVIFVLEWVAVTRLFNKYGLSMTQDGWEGFISKASLDDILRARHHSIMGFCSMCLMTMARLFEPLFKV